MSRATVAAGLVRAGASLAAAGAAHATVNAALLRRPSDQPPAVSGRVSVLLPVRDEVADVGECLRSLMTQPVAEILVLDDGSADGTHDAAVQAAGDDPRVHVLTGVDVPAGWLGKPHACAQLAWAADPASEVLVFVDADVRLAPHAVAAAVDLLDAHGLDVVCPYPRQSAVTAAERLVQPLLQWSWLTFLPLRIAERSPRPSLVAANGQFLVIRRAAYERAGGFAAVRDAVLDDVALARAVTLAGGRAAVVDGTALAGCRMYDGWPAVRDGYSKSLWSAFGSPAGAVAVVAVLDLAYIVPAVAALRGSRAGLAGYAAAVAGRVVCASRTGGRSWPDALAHPVSVAVISYLTARSIVQKRRGALSWKGRPV